MRFDYFLQNRTILDNGYAALSPRVSIVMPTYSRMAEGFLSRCIDSVLGQSYRDFEFIIIDDGSVDGSQGLITAYACKDPRIVYVRHDENSGLPAVRTNEGILLARADFVAFIFDDNVWELEALSVMMESMLQSPVDVLHANTRMVQDEKNHVDMGGWPLTVELLQYSNTIPNGAVLCSREFFDRYGLYDPHLSLRRICDWDLWRRSAHFGAKFRHLDTVLGIELGPSSPVSLGNSVGMDYKVVFSYMTDDVQLLNRTESLRPANIHHYDVFDPWRVFPYIRDESEWKEFQRDIYQPFFDKHPDYSEAAPALHNRVYESRTARSLNAYGSIFRDKKRALIICNRFTPLVQDWKDSFESSPGCIAVTCAEWQASAFRPQELDYLILVDCAALSLKPFVQECRDHGVAIGYVVMHGMDAPAPEKNPLKRLAFAAHDSIWATFKTDIYFPHCRVPWSATEKLGAMAMMKLSNQVFLLGGDAGTRSVLPGVEGVGLPYLARKHGMAGIVSSPLSASSNPVISFYMGDPAELPSPSVRHIIDVARKLRDTFAVRLLMHRECGMPEALAAAPDLHGCLVFSDESLLSWSRHFQEHGLLVVPDAIADQVSEYFLPFLQDDLAGKGAALLRLSDLPLADSCLLDQEWLMASLKIELERAASRQSLYQEGCRLTQFACAADSLLLKQELRLACRHSSRIAVLLNSPLFAGSEAYGLLLARALFRMGFEVMTCVPNIHGHGGSVSPDDINAWLKANGMPEVLALNYGFGIQSFDYPAGYCREHSRLFNECLDQQGVSLVLCAGFIPDPLMARSAPERPVFMALFQPWGYPLEKMTFLRDRVAGIMADSEWAASYWARWLPPPVVTVPTPLVSGRLKTLNDTLAATPICVAVGGTLQPRKRQKEAIEAVRELRSEGYDIRLNIYGYELDIVSEYVRETKGLIEAYQLGSVVKLHGLVDVEEIFRSNHIILSASLDESLPQTLLFAMAAGLVAVACPAGGIPEIVIDGKTGYLGTGFSVADIKKILKRALDDRQEWPTIQAQAAAYLAGRHGELNVSRKLLKVLLEGLAIEKSPGRRLFPLEAEAHAVQVSVPRALPLHLRMKAALTVLKRKLFERIRKLVRPYLSPQMKNRIRYALHRFGLF